MRVSRSVRRVVAAAAVGILSASVAGPASGASDVNCSGFPTEDLGGGLIAGIVTPGNHNYNIIVDINCVVGPGAHVNGSLFEPATTPYSILVAVGGSVNGNIDEQDDGVVTINGQAFDGSVFEQGDGDVNVILEFPSNTFDGSVEERDAGNVDVVINNGYYQGSIHEAGAGLVSVQTYSLTLGGGSGFYNGSIYEQGDGLVDVDLDEHGFYNGSIQEAGGGNVHVRVAFLSEFLNGNVEELGLGDVVLTIGGDYNGNAVERDGGNVTGTIGVTGDFNGNVVEREAGTCAGLVAPPGQPRGNIDCDP